MDSQNFSSHGFGCALPEALTGRRSASRVARPVWSKLSGAEGDGSEESTRAL